MFKYKKLFLVTILSLSLIGALFYVAHKGKEGLNIPLVAIANWGPHSSLEASISGIKEELERQGLIEGKNIRFQIADVGFDTALIPQMVVQLKSSRPKVMVAVATPVAQYVKNAIKEIPVVFNVITDPVEAGLLKEERRSEENITGASDRQDLELLLGFAKKLIPDAKRVGLLYATSEANDLALVKILESAAAKTGMTVVALPINQARDVPMQMRMFKDRVDFLYVGASGPIQPTLPAIVAEADKMGIPVFNVNDDAVRKDQVLASFGVDYRQVGVNTGKLVGRVLRGEKISDLQPIYPEIGDHRGFISKRKAEALNIEIPSNLTNTEIVE